MATKRKKAYDLTAKERVEGRPSKDVEKEKDLEKKDRPIYDIEGVVAAPIWRRLIALVIDGVLSYGASYFMLISANLPDTPTMTRFLMLLSALAIQLWFFGLIPGEYMPGQTLGRKLMGIYVRRVEDKKPLGILKSLLREYVYNLLGIILTTPFEIISIIMQMVTNKKDTETEQTLQDLPLANVKLMLPRDTIFKTEAIYVPKDKKM